jgi:hypothetical protein
MPGWTRDVWIKRLRYLAAVCIHEGLARYFRDQADELEAEAQSDKEVTK